jgi:predicted DCC family thiol-disulfide oxidoreductase YuxK
MPGAMHKTADEKIQGWVLYDGACGFCARWVPFWQGTLEKRGFRIAPLQSEWVAEKLHRPQEKLISDFRLLLANGEQLAGADAYRFLMRRIWWAVPLYWISILPVLRSLFELGYRLFADNRYWISRRCHLPAGAEPRADHDRDKHGHFPRG